MNKLTKNATFGIAGAAALALALGAAAPAMAATSDQGTFGQRTQSSSQINVVSDRQSSAHYRSLQNVRTSIALQVRVDAILRDQARENSNAALQAQFGIAAGSTQSRQNDNQRSSLTTQIAVNANTSSRDRTNSSDVQSSIGASVGSNTSLSTGSTSGSTSSSTSTSTSTSTDQNRQDSRDNYGLGLGIGALLNTGGQDNYQGYNDGGDLSLGLGLGAILGR